MGSELVDTTIDFDKFQYFIFTFTRSPMQLAAAHPLVPAVSIVPMYYVPKYAGISTAYGGEDRTTYVRAECAQ